MGRSRSRSPDRRKRDRSRDRDRDRERDRDRDRARKTKKSRRRSESPAEAKLGSILRKRPSPSLKDTPRTLEDDLSNTNFDISKISSTARIWLEERVEEQIISRVEKVERVLNERFLKQKSELEQALRMQIEGEMKEEMERIRKDGEDRQKRCEDLERDWKAKIASAEKKEKEYTEERLAMLQERSQLERERRKLEQERDVLKRSEQQTILNKGGGSRAPIRFTFGAK